MSQACPQQHVPFPRRSHRSAPLIPSAGCFFGDEVRGSGESCAPSDTDASLEAERLGPDQPVPAESVDGPRNPRDSLATGPGIGRTTEHAVEVTSLATPAPGPGLASTPAELPWTNIDLKEPKRAPSHSAAGFPETAGLSSLGLLPLGLEEPYGADDHSLWAWVSGGGCAVEAHSVLKWFTIQSGKHRALGAQHPLGGWEADPVSCLNTPFSSAHLSAALGDQPEWPFPSLWPSTGGCFRGRIGGPIRESPLERAYGACCRDHSSPARTSG